jgi:hypothetical protein
MLLNIDENNRTNLKVWWLNATLYDLLHFFRLGHNVKHTNLKIKEKISDQGYRTVILNQNLDVLRSLENVSSLSFLKSFSQKGLICSAQSIFFNAS